MGWLGMAVHEGDIDGAAEGGKETKRDAADEESAWFPRSSSEGRDASLWTHQQGIPILEA